MKKNNKHLKGKLIKLSQVLVDQGKAIILIKPMGNPVEDSKGFIMREGE